MQLQTKPARSSESSTRDRPPDNCRRADNPVALFEPIPARDKHGIFGPSLQFIWAVSPQFLLFGDPTTKGRMIAAGSQRPTCGCSPTNCYGSRAAHSSDAGNLPGMNENRRRRANRATVSTYARWVCGDRFRTCMSSSMRCRSGVIDGSCGQRPGLFQACAWNRMRGSEINSAGHPDARATIGPARYHLPRSGLVQYGLSSLCQARSRSSGTSTTG